MAVIVTPTALLVFIITKTNENNPRDTLVAEWSKASKFLNPLPSLGGLQFESKRKH